MPNSVKMFPPEDPISSDQMSNAVLSEKLRNIVDTLSRIEKTMATTSDLEKLKLELKLEYVGRKEFDTVIAALKEDLKGKSLSEQLLKIAGWVAGIGTAGSVVYVALKATAQLVK